LPDVEATVRFLSTAEGGRTTPVVSGYRPSHLVREDYLTTGIHDYLDADSVPPGGTATAAITFITPDVYPGTLRIGKIVSVQEGGHVVGYATITKIFNEVLRAAG
jgi:elongation factor Tu